MLNSSPREAKWAPSTAYELKIAYLIAVNDAFGAYVVTPYYSHERDVLEAIAEGYARSGAEAHVVEVVGLFPSG